MFAVMGSAAETFTCPSVDGLVTLGVLGGVFIGLLLALSLLCLFRMLYK